MLWVLGPRVDVWRVATPLLLSATVPKLIPVALSKKFTVPVGLPLQKPGCAVSVAVRVTVCPKLDGFREEASAVLVPETLALRNTTTAPSPVQVNSEQASATIRSGLPSWFKSATVTASDWNPEI